MYNRLIFSFIIFSTICSLQAKDCIYDKKDTCPVNFYCVKIDGKKAECREDFKEELKILELPYNKGIDVWCDQGVLSPDGNSHTWDNTAFALDLKGHKSKPAQTLYAALAGEIISYDQCKTLNDQCGLGFGNQVKILTDDGYILFYAHLEKTLVKTGDKVVKGDPIGVEGNSGWTGQDNRHLHFSLHYDWRPMGLEYWKKIAYLPRSVPFQLNFCESPCSEYCHSFNLDIRKLECLRVNKETKPICRK